ncbi:MAG: carboxypeptidase M32 [Candidatus Hodarchaeales archaeon]|jgi:carboxypeptidase Taq
MSALESYNTLMEIYKKFTVYDTIQSQLNWDFETQMPPKGGQQRALQFSVLATDMHKMITDPKIGKLLTTIKESENYSNMTKVQKRNLHLMQKEYDQATKLPVELVQEMASHQVKSIETWKKAKAAKDYSMFKPELQKSIDLQIQRARYIDPEKNPYDVLLDLYEPNITAQEITVLFNELKAGLVPLIQKIRKAPKQPDISFLYRSIPISIQEKLSIDLSNIVHYDLEKGSITTTEHPFTTGYYDDVRITTHYYENEFDNSMFSVLHEAGHAIYEQKLSPDYIYQPIGKTISLGIHESQSRFIENIIGRSKEFWEFYYPKLKDITNDVFTDIDLDMFVHAINNVVPSKIRVTADEVTYSLHVIIRFEIERDLAAGKITIDELPTLWNQKYKEYLGVDIEDDSEGVMQDTHWAGGSLGYFPTYALGNIYSAHMLNKMRSEISNYDELLRSGNLKPIIDWLSEKVHQHANLYDPADLVTKITGEPVNTKYFLEYCEKKYSQLYGF